MKRDEEEAGQAPKEQLLREVFLAALPVAASVLPWNVGPAMPSSSAMVSIPPTPEAIASRTRTIADAVLTEFYCYSDAYRDAQRQQGGKTIEEMFRDRFARCEDPTERRRILAFVFSVLCQVAVDSTFPRDDVAALLREAADRVDGGRA